MDDLVKNYSNRMYFKPELPKLWVVTPFGEM